MSHVFLEVTLQSTRREVILHGLYGSILLNIHEVWPRPFWRGSSHQNKTPVDLSIGYIPFASLYPYSTQAPNPTN